MATAVVHHSEYTHSLKRKEREDDDEDLTHKRPFEASDDVLEVRDDVLEVRDDADEEAQRVDIVPAGNPQGTAAKVAAAEAHHSENSRNLKVRIKMSKMTSAAVHPWANSDSPKRKEREDNEEVRVQKQMGKDNGSSAVEHDALPTADLDDAMAPIIAPDEPAAPQPIKRSKVMFDFIDLPPLKRSWFRGFNPDNAELYLKTRKTNESATTEGTYRRAPLTSYRSQPNPYLLMKKKKPVQSAEDTRPLIEIASEEAALKRKQDAKKYRPYRKLRLIGDIRSGPQRMTAVPGPMPPPYRPKVKRPRDEDDAPTDDDNEDDDYRPAKRQATGARPKSKLKKTSSGKGSKPPHGGPRANKLAAANVERGCHSCRKKMVPRQMHCISCANVYCESCINNRYDMEFDIASRRWTCPLCFDYCNCDKCMEKHGTRDRFKDLFKGTARAYQKNTGQSLQTWLRDHGFIVEAGPDLSHTIAESVYESEDDMVVEPSQNDIIELSSDDDDNDDGAREDIRELRAVGRDDATVPSPSPSPGPIAPDACTTNAPMALDVQPPVADTDPGEPLFLPDTPETPVLRLSGVSQPTTSARPASEESTSDSTTLITPLSNASTIVLEFGFVSPLQAKSAAVGPVFVPDTHYYEDASNQVWSG